MVDLEQKNIRSERILIHIEVDLAWRSFGSATLAVYIVTVTVKQLSENSNIFL